MGMGDCGNEMGMGSWLLRDGGGLGPVEWIFDVLSSHRMKDEEAQEGHNSLEVIQHRATC